MTGQSSSSLGIAKVFVGEENLIRVSPIVERNRFKMDGIEAIHSLRGLGMSEARKSLPKLREVFLNKPVSGFIPHYSLELSFAGNSLVTH